MFDWMLPEKHAITILKKDHETVKGLFDKFEKTENRDAREKIITETLTQLEAHAVVEEEIFYPTVRAKVGKTIMNEADEEHHVAKILVAELEATDGDYDRRDAKFTVLAESVRHHIKEEENEILPKAKELDIDFEALGRTMVVRKQELLKNGFPANDEEGMVTKTKGQTDSAATTARRGRGTGARKSVGKAPARGNGKNRSRASH